MEVRGKISWSDLTQDIKMGSCVFQFDVPCQWIAQRQVGPVSVYCDKMGCHVLCLYTVTGWVSCPVSVYCDSVGCHVLCLYTVTGWVSCPVSVYCDGVGCHVLCLQHGIPVWQHKCCNWSQNHCYKQASLRYDLRCQ